MHTSLLPNQRTTINVLVEYKKTLRESSPHHRWSMTNCERVRRILRRHAIRLKDHKVWSNSCASKLELDAQLHAYNHSLCTASGISIYMTYIFLNIMYMCYVSRAESNDATILISLDSDIPIQIIWELDRAFFYPFCGDDIHMSSALFRALIYKQ